MMLESEIVVGGVYKTKLYPSSPVIVREVTKIYVYETHSGHKWTMVDSVTSKNRTRACNSLPVFARSAIEKEG